MVTSLHQRERTVASFCAVEVLDPHTGSAGLFHRDTSHGAAAMALKDAWGRCQAGASAMGLYAVSPLESHRFVRGIW